MYKRTRTRAAPATVSGGGGNGISLTTGTETETDALMLRTTLEHGVETESFNFTPAVTLPQGSETESANISVALNAFAPQGTETESGAFNPALTAVAPQGSEAESDAVVPALTVTAAQGSETENAAVSAALTATAPQGTETESFNLALSSSFAHGSDLEGPMTYSGTVFADDYVGTAATSGSPAWANPTNAQGAFNGTEANYPGLSGVTVTGDATLTCSGLVLPAFSGGSLTGANIIIRHRWDLTLTLPVAGVTDETHTIELYDSTNTTLLGTLQTKSAVTTPGTQATLIDDTFDIFAIATPAQMSAGLYVRCRSVSGYVPATAGNTSWSVDGIKLQGVYTLATENTLTIADAIVSESAGTVTMTVTRGTPNGATSVDYATSNRATAITGDTAIEGATNDYTAASGTLNFTGVEPTKTFTVPIINNSYSEPDRNFIVNLSNVSNGIINDGQASVTIQDNEAAKTFLQDFSGNGYDLTAGSTATTNRACTVPKFGNGRDTIDAENQALLRTGDAFNITGDLAITCVYDIDANPPSNIRHVLAMFSTGNENTGVFNLSAVNNVTTSRMQFVQVGTTPSSFLFNDPLSLGYHRITIRRDNTAKTVVIKMDGTEVVNTTYTGSVTSEAGGTLALLGNITAGTRTPNGGMYDFRIWNTAIAQATLDAIVATSGKCKPEGTELAWYILEDT